jgi:predicted phosphohydrolase
MTTQTQNPAYRPAPSAPSPLPKTIRRVWAIADLHLAGGAGKTMDRFGPHWANHQEQIRENVEAVVGPDDVLLLPGDLSWATKRRMAEPDLAFMAALPGIKIAIKGNHDFWWESDKPINYPGLLSPPVILDDGALGIAGSRGWFVTEPGSENEAKDRVVFARERERLRKSLSAISGCATRLAMTHYPPQPFLDDLRTARVPLVAYGHIHIGSLPVDEAMAHDGDVVGGVRLYCVACDRIGFRPRLIAEVPTTPPTASAPPPAAPAPS